MLGGIFIRWKIPVAYYFTPDSVDGALLKPIIEQIIEKTESIGLFVHTVISDMGPLNLSMWRAFGGIFANRNSAIRNSIVHPLDSNRKLMFIADAPHLVKTLRAALLNNKSIELPPQVVKAFNLSDPVVQCDHLTELLDIQENLQFKLIHKIKKQDMKCSTFNKMKVSKATNLWSRDVSSAMKFYACEKGKKEYNTTAH
ncbi:THAP domain-containing protein [Ooceraea biroi]|uniref:THAP domain-containing protein n=1 Tax=Ooceraea biroi TaxID=2015173 RepID=A0A026VWX0_OOCBI|nr:THAP domain-containing protein [Ooceraea biroi]